MKKAYKAYGIFLAVALIVLMTACGTDSIPENGVAADNPESVLPESCIILDTGEWPQNEYIDNIPRPESGTLLRGWIDPDQEYCYLQLSDMTQSKSEQYIQALKEAGFAKVEEISAEINDDYISIGTLLAKDSTIISIAYTDDLFGMYVRNKQ